MSKESDIKEQHSDLPGRRRLLKMVAYVPPAILGVMVMKPESSEGAQLLPIGSLLSCTLPGGGIFNGRVSAAGNACCPCVTNPTGNQCLAARCQLGNCPACNQLVANNPNAENCRKAATTCGGNVPPCNCTWDARRNRWRC